VRVWLAHVGEPLPIDAENERQLRMSLFAQLLAEQGHEVTWWTSTFDHTHKRQRFASNKVVRVRDRLDLHLLLARPYHANISIARLVNHRQAATEFRRIAESTPADELPDVIFATMPTLELAAAAASFGKERGIPVIVDVRDLHPDIYLSLVPKVARPLARIALSPLYRDLRTALTKATALVAIAPSFLDWALEHAGRERSDNDRVFPLAYPKLQVEVAEVEAAGASLRAMGVDPSKKIIWYVGTFNRWIDLSTAIRAARLLSEKGRDDIQLVLSGSGGFDQAWREQAAPLPNVVFTGWIDTPGIAYMWNVASAGLAPYQPGFLTVGNKLFEYMAGGLPILLSIGGDAKNIIEQHDAGIAYTGRDPQSLADSIEAILVESTRERRATNSRNAYEHHYSAEMVYGEMARHVLSFADRRNE
jgi:glycosyltransferase involved in cell wall biosynthesis